MDAKTKGAWLVHHTEKLHLVTDASNQYGSIYLAGRCATLLSGLCSSEQATVPLRAVEALAQAADVNVRIELPVLLAELGRQKLVAVTEQAVDVLALTTPVVLEHATRIYEEAQPKPEEEAVIELSERISDMPAQQVKAAEYLGDTFRIPSAGVSDLLRSAEEIGFVDAEGSRSGRILFNGNIFRRENSQRIAAVLGSLSQADSERAAELNEALKRSGCLPLDQAETMVGKLLFEKLNAIGLFDINTVGNETGLYRFVTRPSAFSKFTNTAADDAFDLAKALVTSLTYGMTQSAAGRGRITMIHALMRRLIAGAWVGPATAIGQDYRVLETKGVIKVRADERGMFSMKLLKKEIGTLALLVLTEGDASSETLPNLPGAAITSYTRPERTRTYRRRNQTKPMKKQVAQLLQQLRTGGL